MSLVNNNNIFRRLKLHGQTADGKTCFINEWESVRYIGKGNFGVVYEIEKETGAMGSQHSALKIIELDEKSIKKYKDEIDALKSIKNHPHGVSIEDYSEVHVDEGDYIRTYLIIRMELLNTIPKEGLPEDEVVKMALDVSDVLKDCHSQSPKILHCDIKPENILIADNGNYKLSDFGEAKFLDKTHGSSGMRGTPFYMSPEMNSFSGYDERSDLYSLGITMYALLNGGKVPFQNESATDNEAIFRRLSGEKFPKLKGVSNELQKIIYKLCDNDPNKRYQRASQLERDLKLIVKKKEEAQRKVEEAEIARKLKERQKAEFYRKKAEERAMREAALEAVAKARADKNIRKSSANETIRQEKKINSGIDYNATVSDKQIEFSQTNKGAKNNFNKQIITVIAIAAIIAMVVTVYFSWHNSFVYVNGERVEKDVKELVFSNVEMENFEALSNYKNIEKISLRNIEMTESELDLVYSLFSDTDLSVDVELYGQRYDSNTSSIVLSDCTISYDEISRKLRFLPRLEALDITNCEVDEQTALKLTKEHSKRRIVWNVDLFGQKVVSNKIDIDLSDNKNVVLDLLSEKMTYFPNLKSITLSRCGLSNNDLLSFRQEHPEVRIEWEVEIFGKSFSTLTCKSMNLRDLSGVSFDVITENLKYFVVLEQIDLSNCGFDSETLWAFDQSIDVDVIWEISLGGKTFYTNITDLDLNGTGVSDISELKYCTKLARLDISYGYGEEGYFSLDNRYNLTDLSPLSRLTSLSELILWGNKISDLSPLSNLKNLWSLDLGYNEISDLSPLSELSNLKSLILSDNKITDISPLGSLKGLRQLIIDYNDISDITILSELHSLSGLNLSCTSITDFSPICSLENLNYLYLHECGISNIEFLSNLTKLESLGMNANNIKDITPLKNLINLNDLSIGANNISDISCLSEMKKLREIDISATKVQNFETLANLPELRVLFMDHNQFKGSNFANESLLLSLRNLSNLYIDLNDFTSAQRKLIEESLPNCDIQWNEF